VSVNNRPGLGRERGGYSFDEQTDGAANAAMERLIFRPALRDAIRSAQDGMREGSGG
jgi:hypothetical protein